MKKNLLLYILLGFLVVMNGYFLFKHFGAFDQKIAQRPSPVNFISQQLDFDAEQLQKLEELDSAHRENLNTIFNDIRSLRDELFDKIGRETSDNSEIDSITSQIARMEKEKELESFHFFRAIGEICTEEQKVIFKTIIKDVLGRQGLPNRKGPSHGRPRDEGRPPPPPRH